MTPELFGMLKALAGGSTLAILLMICIYFLWKENKAKERCADPDRSPCEVCLLCIRRGNAANLVLIRDALKLQGESFAEAVKYQEETHAKEIHVERERANALQDENKKTLRELMDFFKGSSHD